MKDNIAQEKIQNIEEDINDLKSLLEDSGVIIPRYSLLLCNPYPQYAPVNIMQKINAIMNYLGVEEVTIPSETKLVLKGKEATGK